MDLVDSAYLHVRGVDVAVFIVLPWSQFYSIVVIRINILESVSVLVLWCCCHNTFTFRGFLWNVFEIDKDLSFF